MADATPTVAAAEPWGSTMRMAQLASKVPPEGQYFSLSIEAIPTTNGQSTTDGATHALLQRMHQLLQAFHASCASTFEGFLCCTHLKQRSSPQARRSDIRNPDGKDEKGSRKGNACMHAKDCTATLSAGAAQVRKMERFGAASNSMPLLCLELGTALALGNRTGQCGAIVLLVCSEWVYDVSSIGACTCIPSAPTSMNITDRREEPRHPMRLPAPSAELEKGSPCPTSDRRTRDP